MARRYDSRTTIFSPEGRLYQLEYATEAINNAASTIGVLAKDGVVLAADRQNASRLFERGKGKEKIYKIQDHIMAAVAGLTSDANILVNEARMAAQRHMYTHQEPQAIEHLITNICDTKQSYTQFGGLRPFGVSFLFAGWDKFHGYQLYHSDPSGNYAGWKATAIGVNSQSAQTILKEDWSEELDIEAALALAAKVLVATLDTAKPESDRLEFGVLSGSDGNVRCSWLDSDKINSLMQKAMEDRKAELARKQAAREN